MVRFDVIYQPKGPALEYSAWACNIVKSGQRGGGPKSCSHGCLYCYNPPGTQDGPILKDDIIERLKTDLKKLKDIIKPGEKLEFTFVGDLYDPKLPAGVARGCLQACKDANIPFQVLTKNGIDAKKDFDLYGPNDLFGVTLTCDNNDDSLRWEPGASLWFDRIEALKLAKERKITTWVSFEPVLDPEQTLNLITVVAPCADKIKVGKLNTKNNQPWHNEEIKERGRTISWEAFGKQSVELLEKLGKDYYIKADLAPFITKHLTGELSEIFDDSSNLFVLLPEGIKFPPIEAEWEKKEHAFKEAKSHLGNVGILAGNGYIGLDQDVPGAFNGLELPPSTIWETRPGRRAMRFSCDDRTPEVLAKYGKKPDQAQIKLYKDQLPIGEIKLERSYQVIPPSWKRLENGLVADYKMIEEIKPSKISLEKLLADLKSLGITFSKNERLEKNIEKLEKIGKESRQKRLETDEVRAKRYAEVALKGEVEKVRNAVEGERNDQLFKSTAALAEFIGAGLLTDTEIKRALERVAEDDEPEKIPRTIASGLEAGKRKIREIPKNEGPIIKLFPPKEEGKTPETIHDKALNILQHADPLESIVTSCSRMVLGAEVALRKLVCCVAVQDVVQSEGLHPRMSGESGAGKTAAAMIFAHHLPADAVLVGSMSSKAAFYHPNGDKLFRILDDYQAGNEDLDTIIKQTTSLFHEKYLHRTVINQKAATLQIGSEQTWAITSVDSSQDVQVLNRQIPINVDDSEELTIKVNHGTILRYGEGKKKFLEDEEVEICREIWRILRDEGQINIRVPFWEEIEWIDTSNRRNPSIFMDLLIAHTAMFRHQREIDTEGYYLAAKDDFNFACKLFLDKEAEELIKRLTRKEREFAELLRNRPDGLMKKEAADLLKVTGQRICQLAYGEGKKGGLMQKLPGFSADEIIDTDNLKEDEYGRATSKRSIKKTLFSLKGYNSLDGFESIVRLRKDRKDV